jgi:hypothetical protein
MPNSWYSGHENAVLRRQTGRVRYQPADRLWLSVLSRLIPRQQWAEAFAVTPGRCSPGTGLGQPQMGLPKPAASRTTAHRSRDPQACHPHRDGQSDMGAPARARRTHQAQPLHRGLHGVADPAGRRAGSRTPAAPARPGSNSSPRRPTASSRSISSTWTPCCPASPTAEVVTNLGSGRWASERVNDSGKHCHRPDRLSCRGRSCDPCGDDLVASYKSAQVGQKPTGTHTVPSAPWKSSSTASRHTLTSCHGRREERVKVSSPRRVEDGPFDSSRRRDTRGSRLRSPRSACTCCW